MTVLGLLLVNNDLGLGVGLQMPNGVLFPFPHTHKAPQGALY